MPRLSRETIEAAIEGFENKKRQIDEVIAGLRAELSGSHAATADTPGKKRKFSAAAIKRMREAQKRRWAAIRGESAPAQETAAKSKSKRRLSAAGRKAISEAAKRRWAAKKSSTTVA